MIVRRCAYDHDVVIHKNNKPNMTKTIELKDGTRQSLTYPSSKAYFLVVDGVIVTQSDSFPTIESAYVKECSTLHSNGHGHIDIVKHKLINNKVTER